MGNRLGISEWVMSKCMEHCLFPLGFIPLPPCPLPSLPTLFPLSLLPSPLPYYYYCYAYCCFFGLLLLLLYFISIVKLFLPHPMCFTFFQFSSPGGREWEAAWYQQTPGHEPQQWGSKLSWSPVSHWCQRYRFRAKYLIQGLKWY